MRSPSRLIVLAAIALSSPSARADQGDAWAIRALPLQHAIDVNAPLAETHWLATHNSFGNPEDDQLVDFNQPDSIRKQLDKGVRQIGFDVHYADGAGARTGSDAIRICHNNVVKGYSAECGNSTGDRKLEYGLGDITQWLARGNQDQVVILRLDIGKSAHKNINKVEKVIEKQLGDLVYRPDAQAYRGNKGGDGCTYISPSTTKRDVLLAGKNIILLSPNDCEKDGGFNGLVFYQGAQSNADVSAPGDISTAPRGQPRVAVGARGSSVIYRAADGVTRDNKLEEKKDVKLRPSNVTDWFAAGLNIFEVYGYAANDNKWNKNGERTIQPRDMVWSWREGEPSDHTDERCATADDTGRINDDACASYYRVACRKGNAWVISERAGAFADGAERCGGDTFDVPRNYADLQALKGAMERVLGVHRIWINLHDQSITGRWQAGGPVRSHHYSAASGSATDGSAFDDTAEIARDLYTRAPRRVTKVRIRSGARVDQVGLVFAGGREVHHGGDGGSLHEWSLAADEHVIGYKICTHHEKKISTRVYYLELLTSKGRTLAGGKAEGTCSDLVRFPTGHELVGFVGRAGGNVDRLGFIARDYR